MAYRVLADAVVVLHALFVAFVTFGGLVAVRWPRVAWAQVPCAAYGVAIEIVGWTCPLTPLENRLRALGGEAGYAGGFVEHYLVPLVYPEPFPRLLAVAMGAFVLAVNGAAYSAIALRSLRRRRGKE